MIYHDGVPNGPPRRLPIHISPIPYNTRTHNYSKVRDRNHFLFPSSTPARPLDVLKAYLPPDRHHTSRVADVRDPQQVLRLIQIRHRGCGARQRAVENLAFLRPHCLCVRFGERFGQRQFGVVLHALVLQKHRRKQLVREVRDLVPERPVPVEDAVQPWEDGDLVRPDGPGPRARGSSASARRPTADVSSYSMGDEYVGGWPSK